MSKQDSAVLFASELKIAADAEGKGPARFEMAPAYSGGLLNLANYPLPVVVDLAGAEFHRSVIADLFHESRQIVGHVTEKVNDGKQISFSGVISATGPAADQVLASHANGFPWEGSIEARRVQMESVPAGRKVTVNQQQFTGPILVARKSLITRVTFTPQGADPGNHVRIAAEAAASTKEYAMEPELEKFIKAAGFDPESLTEQQIAGLKANYDGLHAKPAAAPAAKPHATTEDIVRAAEAENTRVESINARLAEALGKYPNRAADLGILASEAIEKKHNAEQFELTLFRANLPQGHTVIDRSRRGSKTDGDVLMAAICMNGRLNNLDKHFSDQTLQAAHDHYRHGIGLKQLYRIAAQANGYMGDVTGDVTLDMQRYAFGMAGERGGAIQASTWSTLNLSGTTGILSNTANKFLLEGWSGQDMAWQSITSKRNVSNFQTVSSYRLSGTMKYEKVGAGGELKHGAVGEDRYTNKADTYGKMFAITRTDIINDDLSALTAVPRELGAGANEAFNDVFYTEFLDNSSFFTSGNNNVSTGAGSALSIAGLVAAELVFMNQTKPNGTPLGLMPTTLFVPPALYRTALGLMQSTTVVSTTTANAPLPDQNTFAGNYKVVTSPYLSNSNFTGYSTAAYYLLAEPSRMSAIETAFLNGRESPVVETADAAFGVLGVEMRAYHDFGVNLQEYRAGVRSAGS